MSKKITWKEALEIAQKILKEAEQRRIEFAEKEAKQYQDEENAE